jgi:hypothetical protein
MRRLFAIVSIWLFLAGSLFAKETTIRGFVTDVKSPTVFEIDDYKVTRDRSLAIDISAEEDDKSRAAFKPQDLRIGTELEVKGDYDESTGELKAKSIKVIFEDARKLRRTALLEQLPSLTKKGAGWEGEIRADGQRITVSPETSLTIKLNKSERENSAGKKNEEEDSKNVPLTSLDELNLDTFLRYEGTQEPDGSINARKIVFHHGELEPGEAKLWRRMEPKIKEPDYSSFAPGELKMHWEKKYHIVPDREAQDYIAKLGEDLVPAHQRDLPANDPLKIPFRFYLVEGKSFNATAYPNGVVLVHSSVFDFLQNEAQLAFVLAHEISHAVEKHQWQALHYHRTELAALSGAGAFIPFGGGIVTTLAAQSIQSQFARSLEDQADRVGLEWMLAAGYDIREAPASWKAVSMKKGDWPLNPFWDDHNNFTTRRSYLMAELKNNYSDVDYSKLKKDSPEFHHVAELVKTAEAEQKADQKADQKKDESK